MSIVGELREARRQCGEGLGRRSGPRKLFVVQCECAVEVEDGNQAPVEPAFFDRDVGPSLGLGCERVERFTRNPFERGDRVGTHALMRLWMQLLEMHVVRPHRQHPFLGQGHHLRATRDHEVLHAGHDGIGGDVCTRNAGTAEAIEGDSTGLDVVAGVERGHATEIAGLFADLRTRSPNHVVDFGGIETVSLLERAEHGRSEMLWVQVRKGSLALLADSTRGTAGVDDECVGHGKLLMVGCIEKIAATSVGTSSIVNGSGERVTECRATREGRSMRRIRASSSTTRLPSTTFPPPPRRASEGSVEKRFTIASSTLYR